MIKKYDGTQWSEPDTVSTGLPGSMHNRLVVDNNNKLYCFWYNGISGGKIFYRTLENGNWGEITMPFNNADELYFLNKVICDKFNNLHCQGAHQYQEQSYQQIMYFTFNTIWSSYSIVNQGAAWAGSDMALENGSIPHIAWRQQTSNTIPPNDGTSYSYLNNNHWTDPYLLVEDPSNQAIIVDKNNVVYIIDNEKTESGFQQVQYKKTASNWIGEIIGTNSTGFYEHILLSSDTVLFLG